MDNIDKWVKIGIAGSAIWTFLTYLPSNQGLDLRGFDFDFRDDAVPVVLAGCAVIWIVSFLFFRDEEE